MGPVSWIDRPKKKPESLLFKAADANETGAYVGARDMVQRNQMFTSLQRDETKALGQGAKKQEPEHVEVKRVPQERQAGVLSPSEWAEKVHPYAAKKQRLSRRMIRQLRDEYDRYVSTQLAIAQFGETQQRTDIAREGLDVARERTKAAYPEGWRGASRGQEDADDLLAMAAFREQLAKGKTATEALQIVKAAAAGGRSAPGLKQFNELVFGVGGVGGTGLLADLQGKLTRGEPQKGPVGGWVKMYRVLNGFVLGNPHFREAVVGLLAQYEPTVQEFQAALDSGKLTPADQAFVEEYMTASQALQRPSALPEPALTPAGGFQPGTFMGE
ncbi:MAG: hypothetical protein ACYTAN_09755 [Planctomycetota bacterium]|jgi:hypothetical protein